MKTIFASQVACGLAFLASISPCAFAGSYTVDPVRIWLSAREPLASMAVHNTGGQPTVVQVETSRWSQSSGQMVLEPTGEVLATPPIFTIPPGGTQLIRLGLRRPVDAHRELTYRVILHEVLSRDPDGAGLRVALDLSIPVFVKPRVPCAPSLHWQLSRGTKGELRLHIANTGTAHIRLETVEIAAADTAKAFARQNLSAYLLPDDSRSWILESAKLPSTATVVIRAQTDAGEIERHVQIESDLAPRDASASQPVPEPR